MVKNLNNKTQVISYIAMFSALLVVANFVYVPLGAMAISFVPTIAFLAGVLINPWVALMAGLIGDTLGCFLKGYPPAPLILLGTASWGFVLGMVVKHCSWSFQKRMIIGGFLAYLVGSVLLTSTGMYLLTAKGSNYFLFVIARIPVQFLNFVVNLIITFMVLKSIRVNKSKEHGI